MKTPKNDSLINRTLFNCQILPSINKNTDINKNTEYSQSQENKKEQDSREENQVLLFSGSKGGGKVSYEKAVWHGGAGVSSAYAKSLNSFFYFKEFFVEWLEKLSFRANTSHIIFSTVIYMVAICSTLQRRENNRWFSVLLDTKMPGYSTLYQETDWETFKNRSINLKLDQKPKHSQLLKKIQTNGSLKTTKKGVLQSPIKNINIYKDKAFVNLHRPWDKQIKKDFVGFFIQRPCLLTNEWKEGSSFKGKGVDEKFLSSRPIVKNNITESWYKVDACHQRGHIILPTTTSKEKLLKLSSENVKDGNLLKNKSYLQFLCNKEKTDLQKQRERNLFWLQPVQKFPQTGVPIALHKQTAFVKNESSFLTSTKKRKHNQRVGVGALRVAKLASPSVALTEQSRAKLCVLRAHTNKKKLNKINGWQYVLPFQTSKTHVYLENDSLPSKLESCFSKSFISKNILFSNRARSKATRSAPTPLAVNNKDTLNVVLNLRSMQADNTKFNEKKEKFFGKKHLKYQKAARNLFYLYGILPCFDITTPLKTVTSSNGVSLRGPAEAYSSSAQIVEEPTTLQNKSVHEHKIQKILDNTNLQIEDNFDHLSNNTQSEHEHAEGMRPLKRPHQKNENKEAEFFSLTKAIKDPLATGLTTTLNIHTVSTFDEVLIEKLITSLEKLSENLIDQLAINSISLTDLKKWIPMLGTSNVFPSDGLSVIEKSWDMFKQNSVLPVRYMSGYKFPDSTPNQINYLFKRFVLRHLIFSPSICFSWSYLTNQIVLRPLLLKFPPFLPFSFFKELAITVNQEMTYLMGAKHTNESVKLKRNILPTTTVDKTLSEKDILHTKNDLKVATTTKEKLEEFYKIKYKRISLQELKEIKELFQQLGKDYVDYLNMPKDSALAIRLSPSLEDDKSLQLEAENKSKQEDERPTSFERLQDVREKENRIEKGKELRPLALENKFVVDNSEAFNNLWNDNDKITRAIKKNNVSDTNTLNKVRKPGRITPEIKENESWVHSRLGIKNMLSDRKQDFFGQKQLLTKRLVAHEQKEINDQLLQGDFCASKSKTKGSDVKKERPFGVQAYAFSSKSSNSSISNPDMTFVDDKSNREIKGVRKTQLELNEEKENKSKNSKLSFDTKFGVSRAYSSSAHDNFGNGKTRVGQYTQYKRLQRKAGKGLIRLLGAPDLTAGSASQNELKLKEKGRSKRSFAARPYLPSCLAEGASSACTQAQGVAVQNRTQKPNAALKGKLIRSAYSHLRWQKKRFGSSLLGTPNMRHIVLPEISTNEWKKILEWQLKNYLFLEEKRLQPLIKENPEKHFKVKRLQLYLPWIVLRTAVNKPFQWPLTRLDQKELTFSLLENKKYSSYRLPFYAPVTYWDSGKAVSLSKEKEIDRENSKKVFNVFPLGVGKTSLTESYLCEPFTQQSWLLIYRLFLAFTLKDLLKYLYRVSLKDFVLKIANSDLGLMTTSPEVREWLEHAPPKSFYKPQKRLQDVAAIEESLPNLSDVIWYLRNGGRGRSGACGLLLVGPAGAEKTSVVQAIAGECKVPVVVQSMSALTLTSDEPYERLEKVFRTARQQAPCVLFLDDLDSIGQSRANVITNDVGAEDLLFTLDTFTASGKLCLANMSESLHTDLLPGSVNGKSQVSRGGSLASEKDSHWVFNPLAINPVSQPNSELLVEQGQTIVEDARASSGQNLITQQQAQEVQTRRLNLLLRLLTEMDGISPLNGVVIVSTSEQPALLDPALLRAGRFERRIHLSLPNKERRIQLFKRSTKRVGTIDTLPWDYLGLRTIDMSVADILSAINHSAIRAILDNTVHTVETLEHGLNCVLGLPVNTLSKRFTLSLSKASKKHPLGVSRAYSSSVKHTKKFSRQTIKLSYTCLSSSFSKQGKDPYQKTRLAFYQAGKAVVHTLLVGHPKLGFLHIDELSTNANKDFFSATTNHGFSRENIRVLLPDQEIEAARFTQFFKKWSQNTCESKNFNKIKNIDRWPLQYTQKSTFAEAKLPPLRSRLRVITNSFSSSSKDTFKTKLSSSATQFTTSTTNSARTRIHFETRLIGLYAGKAAELLHVSQSSLQPISRPNCKLEREFKQKSKQSSQQIARVMSGAGVSSAYATSSTQASYDTSHALQLTMHSTANRKALGNRHPRLGLDLLDFRRGTQRWDTLHLQRINGVSRAYASSAQPLAPEGIGANKRANQVTKAGAVRDFSKKVVHTTSMQASGVSLRGPAEAYSSSAHQNSIQQNQFHRADWFWQSNLGFSDLLTASSLIHAMIDRWYLYSQKLFTFKINKLLPSLNFEQTRDETLYPFAKKFNKQLEFDLLTSTFWGIPSGVSGAYSSSAHAQQKDITEERSGLSAASSSGGISNNELVLNKQIPQERNRTHWWSAKLCQALEMKQRPYGKWYRIYLPKVEERESNEEWVPPDRIMHQSLNLSNIAQKDSNIDKNIKTLNDLYLHDRDTSYQDAVTNCFYAAYNLLNDHRELLDMFADHLIRFKVLRSHEISHICSLFLELE